MEKLKPIHELEAEAIYEEYKCNVGDLAMEYEMYGNPPEPEE